MLPLFHFFFLTPYFYFSTSLPPITNFLSLLLSLSLSPSLPLSLSFSPSLSLRQSFMTNENSVVLRSYCSRVTAGPMEYEAQENWKVSAEQIKGNRLLWNEFIADAFFISWPLLCCIGDALDRHSICRIPQLFYLTSSSYPLSSLSSPLST